MKHCRCSEHGEEDEFDARAAFEELSLRQDKLADIMMQYMSEASLKRPKRAENALTMMADVAEIIGGVPTMEFPDCCAVSSARPCSGVLIHPQIALTAAHCASPAAVRLNAPARNVGGEVINVLRTRRHPDFNSATGFFDIRILILQRPSAIPFVELATAEELFNAAETTVVGYGRSEIGAGQKRAVTIAIDRAPNISVFDPAREFKAGGNGRGACDGDSGGPAYIRVGNTFKLAGLTSRAVNRDCRNGAIYTKVHAHLDFIRGIADGIEIEF